MKHSQREIELFTEGRRGGGKFCIKDGQKLSSRSHEI